jgi:hypothetical protein
VLRLAKLARVGHPIALVDAESLVPKHFNRGETSAIWRVKSRRAPHRAVR